MNKTQQTTDAIIAQGILPLYYNSDETVSLEVLKSIYKAGIQAVEYTNRGDAALANFKKMVILRDAEMHGLLLGVGTIKNLKQAQDYLDAGADFVGSPRFVTEVAAFCVVNDILYAPGCMTPTDTIADENAGIKFINLFPGNTLGTECLTTIKEIHP